MLTTSVSLGIGPLVAVVTANGQSFSGWIVGRDDTENLALIRVEGASLPGVRFGDSRELETGREVLATGYPESRPDTMVPLEVVVAGTRTDFASGSEFLRLDVRPRNGTQGGPVFDNNAHVLALTVENSYVESLGLPVTDETHALTGESLTDSIPDLEEGVVVLTAPRPTPTPNPSLPPPLPVILKGKATVDGHPAAEGTRLYAHLFAATLQDMWFPATVAENGKYSLTVGVLNPVYTNASIEFYVDGEKATQVVGYEQGQTISLDLTF